MVPSYKYPNLKNETNSSGQVDLIQIKNPVEIHINEVKL